MAEAVRRICLRALLVLGNVNYLAWSEILFRGNVLKAQKEFLRSG